MSINSKADLASAKAHEVTQFLNEKGVRDHYFVYNNHPHSDALREHGKKNPQLVHTDMEENGEKVRKTVELFSDVAEYLDTHYRQMNSHGQIQFYSEEEQRQMAADLLDGKASVAEGKVVKHAK